MIPSSSFKDGYYYNYSKLTKPSVLKIYSKNFEEMPDEEQIRYLSRIKSIHILLPTKLLYGNDKFIGYSLKSVNKTGKFNRIITTPIDVLCDNLYRMEEEIEYLSNKNIVLRGMNHIDTVYNGELFITNPDKYVTVSNNNVDSSRKINDVNTFLFTNLLGEVISHEFNSEKINKSSLIKFIDKMNDKNIYIKNSDYLDDIVTSENIREYVKKL